MKLADYQEIEIAPNRSRDAILGVKSPWGGDISMPQDKAAEFELGVVYWLEEKQPDFLRPEFRRRARVISITQARDYVTVGFVAVPNPPVWSQETDPESRQLAAGIIT